MRLSLRFILPLALAIGVIAYAVTPFVDTLAFQWFVRDLEIHADREVVDKHEHVRVPPENPSYQIRRVWLTKEEEAGYYFGLANEGIWPLCHIAHTLPTFRISDWKQYLDVNQKFADAVVKEAKTKDPVILVQVQVQEMAERINKRFGRPGDKGGYVPILLKVEHHGPEQVRGLIQEFTVYRWAGKMLIDAARLRNRTRFLGKVQSKGRASLFS